MYGSRECYEFKVLHNTELIQSLKERRSPVHNASFDTFGEKMVDY